ncbi:FAD-binding domain-containing protein [Acaromyces ingoldii]|uniref:FAD-binding domain-containing protein n=1 Tax=Acaromyces ingoldii TaxID=215250 RepID=A0A316YIN2_9BASI|nr:FAD-binding domain-containing protein [Acaromyces ingoldii]PWN89042.1 FAD-binding domain-containing protein [Acaromyces ingoldii]
MRGLTLLSVLAFASGVVAQSNAACDTISKQLGASKVQQPLSLAYTSTTNDYWNKQQALNKPACVVQPNSTADVSAAVKAIRSSNATMAVKAAGHNTNNFWSSTNGGVLLDLTKMTGKSFDAAAETATYQPGSEWGDLYEYYEQYNRTVVGGRLAFIGTGLALGGGLSHLSQHYGLACDNFRSLEVVLSNGTIVTASPKVNSDLFLALKGGGNQFGIVTSYTVAAHPIGNFWGGIIIYDGSHAAELFELGRQFNNNNKDPRAAIIITQTHLGTPDLLQKIGIFIPALDDIVIVFNVYDGPDGSKAFADFTAIPHVADLRSQQKYSTLTHQQDVGAVTTGGASFRVAAHRSDNATKVQEILKTFDDFASQVKGTYTLVSLDFQPVTVDLIKQSRAQGGNALASVDGPYFWLNFLFSWTLGAPGTDAALAKFKTLVEELQGDKDLPLFLNDSHEDQNAISTYGAYDQLVAAKKKFDPDNFLGTHMTGPSV